MSGLEAVRIYICVVCGAVDALKMTSLQGTYHTNACYGRSNRLLFARYMRFRWSVNAHTVAAHNRLSFLVTAYLDIADFVNIFLETVFYRTLAFPGANRQSMNFG
ncbi:hypothetical protein BN2476_300207 [Paraburkholderia piptadeniae]|uniref:Uncharacterized protein n=1 Tax=Paraburkholderia piptadeniae TaxID=1701573 RepID=A0A1N7S343_9BURK|nr:hypothetical protein BN2476_300207 [Paraburkholderia piptadeniae]